MIAEPVIYMIGLLVAACYVIFSIDDIIWDVVYFIRRSSYKDTQLPVENLDSVPPKLLAVMVAAWHEDSVLEPVIDNMLASVLYPQSMYHVFLGVYPNDEATIRVAERLDKKYKNVHTVINMRPGPTCKADNINNMISFIRRYEAGQGLRFSSVTVHDSEDVVHPYELKVTNYLLDEYDSLQFPVFPLQRMPSMKNFFTGMTSGTYADEFAENHYRTMGMRDKMAAVVPSAGTGFVLSHRILDTFESEPLFPEDSLTEDYKLSLSLAQKGFRIHYVLEKVQRLFDSGAVKWDYIATRSIFPATYSTAVRQKTRWIYGITMQSAKFADIFKRSTLSFVGRYSLYKDLKAKIGNLLVLPGYLIFIYFIISQFLPLPVMYPVYTFSWWLCALLTFMMVFRQTLRAIAIKNVYGTKSVVFACLLPPFMPIRLVWGNIINLSATLRAWKQLFFGIRNSNKKKVVWNKTDHEFLDKTVLDRYYRNMGDVMLEKKFIHADTLAQALDLSRMEGMRLGDALTERGSITEEQLMISIAESRHKLFVKDVLAYPSNAAYCFDIQFLENLLIYPLLLTRNGYVVAITNDTNPLTFEKLLSAAPEIHAVYTTKSEILKALHGKAAASSTAHNISRLLIRGGITWEQAVLAIENQTFQPDILTYMGLKGDLESAVEQEAAS